MSFLKLVITIFLTAHLFLPQALAQKNAADISGSFFSSHVFRSATLEGTGSIENGHGYVIGVNYYRKIGDIFWFNTGFGYLMSTNEYIPPPFFPVPPATNDLKTEIMRFPIRMRMDLLSWLYFKTGFLMDVDIWTTDEEFIDNQSGIGYSLAFGLHKNISEYLCFNIEPETGLSSIIPFNPDKYQQHFWLIGININIGLRF